MSYYMQATVAFWMCTVGVVILAAKHDAQGSAMLLIFCVVFRLMQGDASRRNGGDV